MSEIEGHHPRLDRIAELANGYMPGWYDLRAADYRLLKPSVWKQLPPEMQALNRHLAEE